MTFLLEDALSSAPPPSRRNEFMTYILETRLPGVHFNVDELPKATLSPQSCFTAAGPRLVDGAREDHMIPEYQQSLEGWGSSDNAAMKILAEGSKGDPSTGGEEELYLGEPDDVIFGGVLHSQCLEFLCRKGPHFLMENLGDKETICSMLLNMADYVKVLPPVDEPLPWDILNMSL